MEEKFCKDCPCLGPIGPLGTRDAKWCAYRDMFLKAQALFPTPPPKSKWDRIREAIEIQGSTNWTTMGEMVKENLLEFIDHLEKEEKDQK